jgi:photosystem II stability/assembly factor-like uncharacterized protein
MRKIIALLFVLAILPVNLNSQWFQVTSPTSSTLYSLYFNNASTGYISGSLSGSVIKTTNGGSSWLFYITGTSSTFYDMYFTDLSNGFVTGSTQQVIKTTNAGLNWDIKTSGSATLYSISFPSTTIGYAVGGSPSALVKSTDGGNNWITLISPSTNTLRGVDFVTTLAGWVCGTNGTIWKTTDGCISWIPQSQSSSFSFEKIKFINTTTGMVCGSNGVILRTTNGGTNWTQVPSGVTYTLYDIYFAGTSPGWAVGANGTIVRTTDSGSNWFVQSSPINTTLYSIHMADINTGYIVGSGGVLLKTTNGGGIPIIPTFQKIVTGTIVTNSGSYSPNAWSDYNNDGFQDLVVLPWNDGCWSCDYPILLYQNNGNGTFTNITNNAIGQISTKAWGGTWGDYDNDGGLDLFLSRPFGANNLLFHNNGNGNFTQITSGSIVNDGGSSTGCAWCDYDKDGWIDLFVANAGNGNFLYHNNGNGTFTKVTSGSIVNDNGNSRGSAWGDYDNDGWPDLFVVNYGGENDYLYHNNGNGTFSRVLSGPMVTDGLYGSSCNWVDYNNDGWLDLFVTNNNQSFKLYRNNGGGSFTDVQIIPGQDGGYCYGSNWGDYDNDGWIDLFVPRVGNNNLLYKNNNGTGFTKITSEPISNEGGHSEAGTWADYNNDGKLDLFVSNSGGSTSNYLYKNNNPSGNYLICKLNGCQLQNTISNRAGIGAKIVIKDGTMRQIREVNTGYSTQNMIWQHFGVGSITNIDSVIVYWPSGNVQKFANVQVNQIFFIDECLLGIISNEVPAKYELEQNYPNPFNPVTTIEYSLLRSVNVKLTVYDINGRIVKTLVNQRQGQGKYRESFDGSELSSGIYIFKLETDEFTDTKKMVLMK